LLGLLQLWSERRDPEAIRGFSIWLHLCEGIALCSDELGDLGCGDDRQPGQFFFKKNVFSYVFHL
jgi:hypothetical protein